MLVLMRLTFFLILFDWAKCSHSKQCPAVYERFHANHTFCLQPNKKCNIKRSGVRRKERKLILKIHNTYRDIIARGKENRAVGGALPKAADMIQMVWDKELAAIAQKWTNNCEYKHDCRDGCRTVDSFRVGQNIARHGSSCSSKKCSRKEKKEIYKPNWSDILKTFYDEVLIYKTKWFNNYQTRSEHIGHFTQIIWSRSWRIGCGYTVYKEQNVYYKFYACNYGPAGNVINEPLYKEGAPCSACPTNSCCGRSCGKKMKYPGLCKMKKSKKTPIYLRKIDDLLFFCDFEPKTKDCASEVTGIKSWKHKDTFAGSYDSIELKGGQTTKRTFKKEIKPSTSGFCLKIIYRKSASKAAKTDISDAFFEIGIVTSNKIISKQLKTSIDFLTYEISLGWNSDTKVAIIFSVPPGGKPHIFDLKEILAHDDKCGSRDT
ncbi:CRISP/Allergen/PR-1 like protein [Argiope bruennichi]|uniref:CRISP/Allergen/PR-1 like protein n=1 Tax=Argiope bruennichi TaxID=94029 RepID=A0A8T0E1F8_ARGBR|nr:CRISP/Allergen/PR-1 like protein [Argiope bruennichi]